MHSKFHLRCQIKKKKKVPHYVHRFTRLPVQHCTEQNLEFSLTEDYCRNHFLVGLLLREVAEALQQGPEVRQLAVSVLKNLLIKHAADDRYTAFKVRGGYCLTCRLLAAPLKHCHARRFYRLPICQCPSAVLCSLHSVPLTKHYDKVCFDVRL